MNLNEIVKYVVMLNMCENVYTRLDGTIAPTPFKMPTTGLYKSDGQFYWLPKRGK